MEQLIKIEKVEGKETVNARDLHEFLESKQHFTDWISRRISDYDFTQGADFVVNKIMTQYNQVDRFDYYISLDMAKELSMIERNNKGKLARKYFIDCEKRLKEIVPQITYSEALRKLADKIEESEKLKAELTEAQPKIEFADLVETSENSITVAEFANLLTKNGFKIGQNNLFKFLRENKYIFKTMSPNEPQRPYQRVLDSGWMEIEKVNYQDTKGNDRTTHKILITGKGQIYFSKIINQV